MPLGLVRLSSKSYSSLKISHKRDRRQPSGEHVPTQQPGKRDSTLAHSLVVMAAILSTIGKSSRISFHNCCIISCDAIGSPSSCLQLLSMEARGLISTAIRVQISAIDIVLERLTRPVSYRLLGRTRPIQSQSYNRSHHRSAKGSLLRCGRSSRTTRTTEPTLESKHHSSYKQSCATKDGCALPDPMDIAVSHTDHQVTWILLHGRFQSLVPRPITLQSTPEA